MGGIVKKSIIVEVENLFGWELEDLYNKLEEIEEERSRTEA